jgi:dihydroorotate dehydrogenase
MNPLLYKSLIRPLLFALDAETAHEHTLKLVGPRPWLTLVPRRPPRASLAVDLPTIPPLRLLGPVGLAAGMDKDGSALMLWERLGFGFVEIGTVLRFPQDGDRRPRIHRIPQHQALRNHMGFPSTGMDHVCNTMAAHRRAGRWPTIPVGINVGINKNVSPDDAPEHYAITTAKLADFADYITINVSSPNTPGLRALQKTEPLRRIIHAVRTKGLVNHAPKPVFVKLSPDMTPEDLHASVTAAVEEGAAGFIATNTTVRRPVDVPGPNPSKGGLSGQPLYPLAREKIAVVLNAAPPGTPVIGVGGIASAEQAAELLHMGCSAVQLYTGLVYEGPGLPHQINNALV